jgi:hypothetical protein
MLAVEVAEVHKELAQTAQDISAMEPVVDILALMMAPMETCCPHSPVC